MSSMKRKNNVSVSVNACSSRSWEEHAFAEDSRGPLGGFIWPPRSYCCSFCRREFRSAQALGGHMNVHRREKAKLKHTVNETTLSAPQNNSQESVSGFFPSRVSSKAALGDQESLDSSSDVKSCVYDEDLVINIRGNGDAEMNLVLGFDVDFCSKTGGGKRRKMTTPAISGLDLELRLGS